MRAEPHHLAAAGALCDAPRVQKHGCFHGGPLYDPNARRKTVSIFLNPDLAAKTVAIGNQPVLRTYCDDISGGLEWLFSAFKVGPPWINQVG